MTTTELTSDLYIHYPTNPTPKELHRIRVEESRRLTADGCTVLRQTVRYDRNRVPYIRTDYVTEGK